MQPTIQISLQVSTAISNYNFYFIFIFASVKVGSSCLLALLGWSMRVGISYWLVLLSSSLVLLWACSADMVAMVLGMEATKAWGSL